MPRSGWLAVGGVLIAIAVPGLAVGRELAVAVALTSLALILVWLAGRSRSGAAAVAATIAVGALIIALRIAIAPPDPSGPGAPPGGGPWSMVVEAVGSPRDGHQVATLRLSGTPNTGSVVRLAATLPRYPAIEPGDVVEVGGRARERPDSPYGQYLERIGAWGTLRADTLLVAPGPDGPARRLERWRREAAEALGAVLPEPEAGLAAGILIGLRDLVDRDVASAFTTAGVSHVVAISGWNIAIVAAAIGALAGRLGRRRRAVVTSIAIVIYIAFAGASPSVLRAGAMAAVVLIALESGRAGRAPAALGWAALLLLVADPSLVGDAGFQLSTLATAGLIAWANPATDRIDRLTGGHLPRWLLESLGISLAAQLATLPIVLASFGRLALIAPAINLLVVPLVAPVMAAGIVALVGGLLVGLGAPLAIGSILAVPAWVGLRIMIGLVDAAANVPFASVEVQPPLGAALSVVVIVGLGVVALVRRRARGSAPERRHGRDMTAAPAAAAAPRQAVGAGAVASRAGRYAVLILVAAVACTSAIAISRPPGVARLSVLDVGQGDAILLEGSRGGRLLVDGGPDPDRLLIELDRRLPPWDRRIDVVILSHPHEDHVAGLALLLTRYRVGRVLEPGMRGPGPGYAAWAQALSRTGAPVRGSIAAGDRLAVDEIRLDVRWPIRGTVPEEPTGGGTGINNVSVVLLGAVGGRRFLLTGDVEDGVDPALLAAGLPRIDVLKIAHHGSRTATTDAFLATVRPRVAIASAGSGNPYGHPARRTLERLVAAGASVYRTDVDGTVTVTFEASGPVVRRDPGREGKLPVPRAALAARAATSRAFYCAVPGFGPSGPQLEAGAPSGSAAQSAAQSAAAPRRQRGDERGLGAVGAARSVGYHRPDDGPHPDRGRCPAALPGSPTLVPRARARRGRGRGLAGGPDRRPRDRRGSTPGGDRRAPPRRGQGRARERPGPGPPARSRLRRLADPTGPPGAGPVRRGAPGVAPDRWRGVSPMGGLHEPGGSDRGLRGQARRSAPGADVGSIRLLATALSGRLGRRGLARRGGTGRRP